MAYIAGNQVAAAKAAGFKIAVIPSEVVNELDIQTTTAPFNKPDVVKAINYAINRQAILQVQASGYGVGRLPAVPARASSATAPSWPTCTPTTRPRPSSCWRRPGTRKGLKHHPDARSAPTTRLAEQLQSQLSAGRHHGHHQATSPSRHLDPVPLPGQDHPVRDRRHRRAHVPGGDAGRALQPAGPDERRRQGIDHARRGDAGAVQGAHRPAQLARLPELPCRTRWRPRCSERADPHLALHQPAHLRLQPDGQLASRRTWCSSAGKASG